MVSGRDTIVAELDTTIGSCQSRAEIIGTSTGHDKWTQGPLDHGGRPISRRWWRLPGHPKARHEAVAPANGAEHHFLYKYSSTRYQMYNVGRPMVELTIADALL